MTWLISPKPLSKSKSVTIFQPTLQLAPESGWEMISLVAAG